MYSQRDVRDVRAAVSRSDCLRPALSVSQFLQNCSNWPNWSCEWQRHDKRWHDCTSSMGPLIQKSKTFSACALDEQLHWNDWKPSWTLGLWSSPLMSPPISSYLPCPDWWQKWAPVSYQASRNIDIHQRAPLKTRRAGGRRLFLMRHVSSSDCFGLLLFPYRLSVPGAAAAAAAQAAAVSSDPPESSQACVNVNAAAVYSPCGREEVDTPLTDVPHSITLSFPAFFFLFFFWNWPTHF